MGGLYYKRFVMMMRFMLYLRLVPVVAFCGHRRKIKFFKTDLALVGERHSATLSKVSRACFPSLANLASTPLFLGPKVQLEVGTCCNLLRLIEDPGNLGYLFVIHIFLFKIDSLYNTSILHDSMGVNFFSFEEDGINY